MYLLQCKNCTIFYREEEKIVEKKPIKALIRGKNFPHSPIVKKNDLKIRFEVRVIQWGVSERIRSYWPSRRPDR